MKSASDLPDSEIKPPAIFRGLTCWLLFPLRLILEIIVTLFDLTLSRHLMAAIAVGIVWLPLHLIADISYKYWLWPSLVIGLALTGLWEGCNIFVIRPYLGNWVLIPDDRSR